jgi:hypothetical protein
MSFLSIGTSWRRLGLAITYKAIERITPPIRHAVEGTLKQQLPGGRLQSYLGYCRESSMELSFRSFEVQVYLSWTSKGVEYESEAIKPVLILGTDKALNNPAIARRAERLVYCITDQSNPHCIFCFPSMVARRNDISLRTLPHSLQLTMCATTPSRQVLVIYLRQQCHCAGYFRNDHPLFNVPNNFK